MLYYRGQRLYNLSYGYNELGTGWKEAKRRLGLGFSVEVTGFANEGAQQPLGPRIDVSLRDVISPGSLIAIGDGASWLTPNRGSVGEGILAQ